MKMINLKLPDNEETFVHGLWELAHYVNESDRIKGRTASELALWDFEEWEYLIRSVAREKLGRMTTQMVESAATAIVIAFRYGAELANTDIKK
jgi:hypothetical protein